MSAAYTIDITSCPTPLAAKTAQYLNNLRESCVGRSILSAKEHRQLGAMLISDDKEKRVTAVRCVRWEIAPALLRRVGFN